MPASMGATLCWSGHDPRSPSSSPRSTMGRCSAGASPRSPRRPGRPDEIVVVDNGSTDDTAAVARAARRGRSWPSRSAASALASAARLRHRDRRHPRPAGCRLDAPGRTGSSGSSRTSTRGPSSPRSPDRASSTARPPPCTGWLEHLYIGGYLWFVGMLLGHPPLFGSNLAIRTRDLAAGARHRAPHHARGARRPRPRLRDPARHGGRVGPERSGSGSRRGRSTTASGFWRRIRWAFGTLALDWESPIACGARRERVSAALALRYSSNSSRRSRTS